MILASIFVASIISGLLGVGVAFPAIPILSIGDQDLVGSVQPLALALNGVSALFSAIAFTLNGHIDWKRAAMLSLSMCIAAPIGAFSAIWIASRIHWTMFYLAVGVAIWLLFRPQRLAVRQGASLVVIASLPMAFVCGMLGIGSGFVIAPLLIASGKSVRASSAITSVAVVPCSFAAFAIRMTGEAHFDTISAMPLFALSAVGDLVGGQLASRIAADRALTVVFAATIIALCGYRSLLAIRPPGLVAHTAVLAKIDPLDTSFLVGANPAMNA